MIYLDDTDRCPMASTCSECGGGEELEVVTIATPVGVLCRTMCEVCIRQAEAFGLTPKLSAVRAVRMSLDHCGHLGITSDQMADIMQQEARE